MTADADSKTTVTRIPFAGPDGSGASPTAYIRLVYSERLGRRAPRIGEVTALPEAGQGKVVIGRNPRDASDGVALALPFDESASRTHAAVSFAADRKICVTDLGSSNGTFVDGTTISGPTLVTPGSAIRVGGTLFVVGEDDLLARQALLAARRAPTWMHVWSSASTALWASLARIADSDVPVLLTGEMGTGKTRLAEALHAMGPRASGPFVAFNCSAIPHRLEEATLFGVAPGFIPTVKERDGWVGRAGRGTLFLDELGDMPALAQAKLLDAFDTRDPGYMPVGGTRKKRTECRLISATNRDVFALAQSGVLRQDLLSRLVTGHIVVPPLRERREELLAVFATLCEAHGSAQDDIPVVPHVEVAEAMLNASWTENIRGLESWAARLALGEPATPSAVREHADRGGASAGPLPSSPPQSAATGAPATSVASVWPPTRLRLLQLLAGNKWRVAAVARELDVRRETVSRRVSSEFGEGGRELAKKAWDVWRASGRVPTNEQAAPLHHAFVRSPQAPGAAEMRANWSAGAPDEPPPT